MGAARAPCLELSAHVQRGGHEDRISNLPDSLVLHILSFLEMHDVIATSLLSRRWRQIWMLAPNLVFDVRRSGRDMNPITFIGTSLMLHRGQRVRKFKFCIAYTDSCSFHVDSWIRFAIGRDVEELDVSFVKTGPSMATSFRSAHRYKLPSYLYSCRTLTALSLEFCDLNLPSTVNLSSLRTLNVTDMQFTAEMIRDLTYGCPLLETLVVIDCNRTSNLNIYTLHEKLKNLQVSHFSYDFFEETEVEIYAPNLLKLEFSDSMPRKRYCVRSTSSQTSVTLNFEGMFDVEYDEESDYDRILLGLLHSICDAKEITLCSWCIQILSRSERVKYENLALGTPTLKLKTGLRECELPAIAYLLSISTMLDTVIIHLCQTCDLQYGPDYWKTGELCFPCPMNCLRTVVIRGFMGITPFPSDEKQFVAVDEFIERFKCEIALVKFFLENAKMLESLVISTTKEEPFNSLENKTELLLGVTRRLLLLPRASPYCKIFFS